MTIDISAVGWKSEPTTMQYGWQQLVLYALGIGAQARELEYLYEGKGPRAYPTFAVVPAISQAFACIERAGVSLSSVVHGGQAVRVLAELPSRGTLRTHGQIVAIHDLKKFAQVMIRTTSELQDGTPVVETEWAIIVRGAGGFGGEPPPRIEHGKVPAGREPDHRFEQKTLPEQALLYRLSGDINPLHADPEVAARAGFEKGPILHGLATFGFATRAIVATVCHGNAQRLAFLHGQFRRPVWPGDTLVTEIWRLPDRVVFQTKTQERNEVVLSNAWADLND
ncbi:MAG TPA: MaoC/PaaZ C-terminal domain-containing protein [Polyangiaceae bacterium]|nr:MAG: MaoC like domain protein [Deltaproteobacteria bacterium ADurb.Bin207]HNS96397.1 MaoC/PaaZ C-terminal domain-containing protein [Polyangiaceae bacterium]HNZ22866.1 MaoC/PaaZ C-terminal domain-containing protein [Polyangiaceae bacterium]HOD21303.1 MaoC/PaaZ C-terminal domain-containing protein [Polyangiaceae bacterium]HOE48462.1 MaoC/PaaZ C-terminal domain-containing protein [Polyangiaceae bacterium]